jgi:hypothetical protein
MLVSVYDWLGKHLNTSNERIQGALNNENATSFFLLWPIFEKECFKAFMKRKHIHVFAH